jgi:hypothetical protein
MASRDRLEAASECIKPSIVAQAVRCLRPVVAPAAAPGAPGPGHATAAVKYGCSDADVSRSAPLDSCRRRTRFGLWYPCPPCLLASLPPRLRASPLRRRCLARRRPRGVARLRGPGERASMSNASVRRATKLATTTSGAASSRRAYDAASGLPSGREQRSVRMAGTLGWLPLLMVPTRHQCRLDMRSGRGADAAVEQRPQRAQDLDAQPLGRGASSVCGPPQAA